MARRLARLARADGDNAMTDKPNITTITRKVDEHFAGATAAAEEMKRAAEYDPKNDLVLSFRHGNKNGECTMIDIKLPDMIIGEVLLGYFIRAGVAAKLIQPTSHPDVKRVLREAP
jgi:hypothetical protein